MKKQLFTKNRERWQFPEVDAKKVKELSDKFKLNNLLARLLYIRKIGDLSEEEIFKFLNPARSLLKDTSNISSPEEIKKALERIEVALKKKEKIVINGDPDADGITGTTILTSCLRQLGASVSYDFPTRAKEGHGLQPRIIDEAKANKVSLIITVDCGSKDIAATEYATAQGIDVIICDHHTLGKVNPPSLAFINPFMVNKKTYDQSMAGAGIALKLMIALYDHLGKNIDEKFYDYLLAIATLGTTSDRMSLLNPLNRILVKKGVQALNKSKHTGLKVLKDISTRQQTKLRPRDVARTIVPRLNAPGRIGDREAGIPDSRIVVDLLLLGTENNDDSNHQSIINQFKSVLSRNAQERTKSDAASEASLVDDVNEKRKLITSRIEDEIDKLIDDQVNPEEDRVIIVKGKNWNPGVIGIDTDRLKERFLRPAIILTEYEGQSYVRGSVRSIPSINMYKVIDKTSDQFQEKHGRPLFVAEVETKNGVRLINAFGGHAQACGFTLHHDDVPEFIALTQANMMDIPEPLFDYHYEILQNFTFEQLNHKMVELLDQLTPYGQAFDYPIFYLKGCHITRTRPFGNKYQQARTPHFEFYISDIKEENTKKKEYFQAIGFGLWEKFNLLKKTKKDNPVFDIIFTIDDNQRMKKSGKGITKGIQLNVQDIRFSKK